MNISIDVSKDYLWTSFCGQVGGIVTGLEILEHNLHESGTIKDIKK